MWGQMDSNHVGGGGPPAKGSEQHSSPNGQHARSNGSGPSVETPAQPSYRDFHSVTKPCGDASGNGGDLVDGHAAVQYKLLHEEGGGRDELVQPPNGGEQVYTQTRNHDCATAPLGYCGHSNEIQNQGGPHAGGIRHGMSYPFQSTSHGQQSHGEGSQHPNVGYEEHCQQQDFHHGSYGTAEPRGAGHTELHNGPNQHYGPDVVQHFEQQSGHHGHYSSLLPASYDGQNPNLHPNGYHGQQHGGPPPQYGQEYHDQQGGFYPNDHSLDSQSLQDSCQNHPQGGHTHSWYYQQTLPHHPLIPSFGPPSGPHGEPYPPQSGHGCPHVPCGPYATPNCGQGTGLYPHAVAGLPPQYNALGGHSVASGSVSNPHGLVPIAPYVSYVAPPYGIFSPSPQVGGRHEHASGPSHCTCKKSRCLKLYCQCFAASAVCNPRCKCTNCNNTLERGSEIQDARRTIQERNPNAFDDKFREEAVVSPTATQQTGAPPPPSLPQPQHGLYPTVVLCGPGQVPAEVRQGPSSMVRARGSFGGDRKVLSLADGNGLKAKQDGVHQGQEHDNETSDIDKDQSVNDTLEGAAVAANPSTLPPSLHEGAQVQSAMPFGHTYQPGCQPQLSHGPHGYPVQHSLRGHATYNTPALYPLHRPPPNTRIVKTHRTGCKCRKSFCLKKYCECYNHSARCSTQCRCTNCKNYDPSVLPRLHQGSGTKEQESPVSAACPLLSPSSPDFQHGDTRSGLNGSPAAAEAQSKPSAAASVPLHPPVSHVILSPTSQSRKGRFLSKGQHVTDEEDESSTIATCEQDEDFTTCDETSTTKSVEVCSKISVKKLNCADTDKTPARTNSTRNNSDCLEQSKPSEKSAVMDAARAMTALIRSSPDPTCSALDTELQSKHKSKEHRRVSPSSAPAAALATGMDNNAPRQSSKRKVPPIGINCSAQPPQGTSMSQGVSARHSDNPEMAPPPPSKRLRGSPETAASAASSRACLSVSNAVSMSPAPSINSVASGTLVTQQRPPSAGIPASFFRRPSPSPAFRGPSPAYFGPGPSPSQLRGPSPALFGRGPSPAHFGRGPSPALFRGPSPAHFHGRGPSPLDFPALPRNGCGHYRNHPRTSPAFPCGRGHSPNSQNCTHSHQDNNPIHRPHPAHNQPEPFRECKNFDQRHRGMTPVSETLNSSSGAGRSPPKAFGNAPMNPPPSSSLPKCLTYRKICSLCGKTRSEHGDLAFGNKCRSQDCGKCGAGLQMHTKAGVPMGYKCTLSIVEGANPAAIRSYESKIMELEAKACDEKLLPGGAQREESASIRAPNQQVQNSQ